VLERLACFWDNLRVFGTLSAVCASTVSGLVMKTVTPAETKIETLTSVDLVPA